MNQLLKPRPLPKQLFEEIQFIPDGVDGSQFRWDVRTYFSAGQVDRITRTIYDFAEEYIGGANKANKDTDSTQAFIAEMKQVLAKGEGGSDIPDPAMVRAWAQFNSGHPEIRKRMLDLICIPKDGAPKASEVYEIADEEMVDAAINFFSNREINNNVSRMESSKGLNSKTSNSSNPSTGAGTPKRKRNPKK